MGIAIFHDQMVSSYLENTEPSFMVQGRLYFLLETLSHMSMKTLFSCVQVVF